MFDRAARALLPFALVNALFLAVDALGFLLAPPPATPGEKAFIAAALFGEILAVVTILSLLFLLIARLRRGRRAVLILAPLAFGLLNIAVFIDRKTWEIFRSHVTLRMLQRIARPRPWEWMGIERSAFVQFGLICGGFILLEALILFLLDQREKDRSGSYRRIWRGVTIVAMLALFTPVLLYRVRGLRWDLEEAAQRIPLLTRVEPGTVVLVDRLLRGASRAKLLELWYGDGKVTVPLHPLRAHDPAHRYNVVEIVLDSWRADAFNANDTPELWNFAKRARVFDRHYSNGNETEIGVFSLLYALPAPYARILRNGGHAPFLFERLHELEYRMIVQVGTRLDWSGRVELHFSDERDARVDYPGKDVAARDRAMVDDFALILDEEPPGQPFFDFLFISSTHSPYWFDPEQAVHHPFPEKVDYTKITTGDPAVIDGLHNRYLNSVLYADTLIKKIIDDLDERGLLDDTIVIVTGDHGEIFRVGTWGHGLGFDPAEIRVPLVVWIPGQPPEHVTRFTSHFDIPTTILEEAGVENEPEDFSFGSSLLGDSGPDGVLACSPTYCGLIDSSGTLEFTVDPGPQRLLSRDPLYRLYPPEERNKPENVERVRSALESLVRFVN